MNDLQKMEQEKSVLRWGGLAGMLGGIVFILMMVPDEIPFQFYEFDKRVFEFSGYFRAPVFGKKAKFLGDVNFLHHKQIQPELAHRWRQASQDDLLGDVTWETASHYGYERPAADYGKDQWTERLDAARVRKKQRQQLRSRRRRT